ncbi:NAD(P)-dependent oxidoreductase [Legionella pneumophila serogroup 2]
MHQELLKYLEMYHPQIAPFMHLQINEWGKNRPLEGVKILHHVPLVPNTLLKIAALVAANAEVTVTNPASFCQAHPDAITCLHKSGIPYVENLDLLRDETFDVYLDCGGQLHQSLGRPLRGAIELTGSGDQYYRSLKTLDFPVISIDHTMTKQLETVFGCAESSHQAIQKLTGVDPTNKNWLIFGFGKIGRGLAYFCLEHQVPVTVVDSSVHQCDLASNLGIEAIRPEEHDKLEKAVAKADIILTATGGKNIMSKYPRSWFDGKILGNLGLHDEFGPNFTSQDVLYDKKPINFCLYDPTPMIFIDPEFYLHNLGCLLLLQGNFPRGMHDIPEDIDSSIIKDWCQYHRHSEKSIRRWFLTSQDFSLKTN